MTTEIVDKASIALTATDCASSENDGSKMTAVAALACLAKSSPVQGKVYFDNAGEADDESDDFRIPQKFTKSGRKRAIPFPLKVSLFSFEKVVSHTWDCESYFSY